MVAGAAWVPAALVYSSTFGSAKEDVMAEEKLPPEGDWRGVSGLRIIIPHGRPDVMLVEIKTLFGPVRLSMPKSVALRVGRSITEEAEKLAPTRSLS